MSTDNGDPPTTARERELVALALRAAEELTRASAAPPPPADGIPGYTLIREIGRGGMGIVYEAEQAHPRRMVALKMISGGALLDRHQLSLFQRETQTLARLRHPGIAAIYEAGRSERGQPFFAMELVRGLSLGEYARIKHLPVAERLLLFRRLCDAVHYAHQRGVIHRDLKPSNIVIDIEGTPKILDFGLARMADTDATVSTAFMEVGKIVGTLAYMSPEQARVTPDEPAAEVDVRSDVYSLGVILYELLTGQLPYDVSKVQPHEALRIICQAAPRRPSTVDRALRGDLETIIVKALDKDPGRRYESVAALAEDVSRFLGDQPIRARPPNVAYLLRKWASRHRSACALTGVLAVVFAAFVSVFVVQSANLARAQREIDELKQPQLAALQRTSGATLRQLADRLQGKAETLMEQRQYDVAADWLSECRKIRSDTLGDTHWVTAYTDSLLGGCLTHLGRFDEAQPLLLSGYPILLATHGASDERTIGALERIIALYEAWGKPERAAEWRAKLPTSRPAPRERVPAIT